ncbi:unnamed protein product [Lathyrus oleraceus]|uniref:F-box protein At5g65850 n=1 Tax=Pisum sativum TaxID=3888 RepID=UPI0021D1323F|nr:F-box protein At5g65850-like [Pisum sativum]
MKTSDSVASAMTSRNTEKEKIEHFADLPYSIITYILLKLPIKAIFTCKCVCKTWNSLILDPHFAALYSEPEPASLGFMVRTSDIKLVSNTLHLFEHQPQKKSSSLNVKFDPKFKLPLRNVNRINLPDYNPMDDKFDVANSCNGLLCLVKAKASLYLPMLSSVNHLVVCNPITGEFIRLPEATGLVRFSIGVGLGFQPKTNEYKVIRIWKRHYKSNIFVVEMHTLGTTTWKNIEVEPMFSSSWALDSPTCVNGALHWINFDNENRSILCLNLESEKFHSFPCPCLPGEAVLNVTMVELNGFLYLCEQISPNSCSVWLMKKYGIGESWTKVFCTDTFNGCRWNFLVCKPIKHFENGCGALLLQESHSCNNFLYFEPDKHRFTYLDIHGAESIRFESIPHIPSLISLKNLAKGNKVEVQNVHFMVTITCSLYSAYLVHIVNSYQPLHLHFDYASYIFIWVFADTIQEEATLKLPFYQSDGDH